MHIASEGNAGKRAIASPSIGSVSEQWFSVHSCRSTPTPDNAEYDYIMLARCDLVIPAPEFDHIKDRASANGSVVISLDGSGSMSGLILTGVWSPTPDTIFATTLIGGGLSASNITLERDAKKYLAMPEGYHWPGWGNGPALIEAGSSSSDQQKQRRTTALAVVFGTLGAAAIVAGAALLVRWKRRRGMHGGQSGKCNTIGCSWCGGVNQGPPEGPDCKTGGRSRRSSETGDEGSDLEAERVHPTRSQIRRGDLEEAQVVDIRTSGKDTETLRLSSVKTIDSAHSLTAPDVRRSMDNSRSSGAAAAAAGAAASGGDNGGDGIDHISPQQQQQQQQDLPVWQLEVLTTVQEDGAGTWGNSSSTQAGWQRVHHLISTMSQNLQQRRLQASLPGTAPTKSGSQNSSGCLDRQCQYDLPGQEQEPNGALELVGASPDGIVRGSSSSSASGGVPQLQLLGIIGRGTFAMVYRALWRGCLVAVKVLHLPASGISGEGNENNRLMSSERMAVMEAVISTNMSHPNIVQVSSQLDVVIVEECELGWGAGRPGWTFAIAAMY